MSNFASEHTESAPGQKPIPRLLQAGKKRQRCRMSMLRTSNKDFWELKVQDIMYQDPEPNRKILHRIDLGLHAAGRSRGQELHP